MTTEPSPSAEEDYENAVESFGKSLNLVHKLLFLVKTTISPRSITNIQAQPVKKLSKFVTINGFFFDL